MRKCEDTAHVMVHTEGRRYVCMYCDYSLPADPEEGDGRPCGPFILGRGDRPAARRPTG